MSEPVIDRFTGQYAFLSNFYPSPVLQDGAIYPTVEHAYQASKTDVEYVRKLIRQAATPGIAKRLGRSVLLRYEWDNLKIDVMRDLLRKKFLIPELRQKLLQTGNAELIEGNYWGDTYWGVCDGVGENRLGKLLMEERTRCTHFL